MRANSVVSDLLGHIQVFVLDTASRPVARGTSTEVQHTLLGCLDKHQNKVTDAAPLFCTTTAANSMVDAADGPRNRSEISPRSPFAPRVPVTVVVVEGRWVCICGHRMPIYPRSTPRRGVGAMCFDYSVNVSKNDETNDAGASAFAKKRFQDMERFQATSLV